MKKGKWTQAEFQHYLATGQEPEEAAERQATGKAKHKRQSQGPKQPKKSAPLAELLRQLSFFKMPEHVFEYRFHDERKYRFDLAWPFQKVAVEYNGIHGQENVGHASVAQLMRDYRKGNEAQLCGWLLITVDAASVRDGEAREWVLKAFQKRGVTCDLIRPGQTHLTTQAAVRKMPRRTNLHHSN